VAPVGKGKWLILPLLWFFLASNPPSEAAGYNPRLPWREITTSHFRVIFPEHLRTTAQETAQIAEEILPDLEAFLETSLSQRISIVLSDHSDLPGGYTDPLGGAIHLSCAEPYEIFANGTRFQSWLRMVLAHELTHFLHLQEVGENLRLLRSLLGYVVLPNLIQPFWVWEGYAMYGEGKITGREIPSPLYQMVLATQAIEGGLWPQHFVRGYSFPPEWPGKLGVYIYGLSVVDYIARTFGEEKLAELSRRRSRTLSPFGFAQAVKKTLGISVQELWQRWQEEVQEKAERESALQTSDFTPIILSDEGYATMGFAVSPDERELLYSLSHLRMVSGLRMKDFATGKKRLLCRGTIVGKPSFSSCGTKVVYAKLTPERYKSFGDLYLYDGQAKKEKRLTFAERAFSPVFVGERILFLRRNRTPEELVSLDLKTGAKHPLFTFTADFHPVNVESDGHRTVVSGWRGGKLELALLDPLRGPVPLVAGVELWPEFSLRGNLLLFSALWEGSFQAFALDLTTNKVFLLTRTRGGFFAPILREKGLYGLLYTPEGFQVAFIPGTLLHWEKVNFPKPPETPAVVSEEPLQTYPEHRYRPGDFLSPRYLIPLPGGFTVGASDPLNFHEYSLTYTVSPDGNWNGELFYQGKFMEPELTVSLRREDERWSYGVTLSGTLIAEETRSAVLRAGYERFFREDSLYPGCWEGWFAELAGRFQGGNDRFLGEWGGTLWYRRGFLEKEATESTGFTIWSEWQKARTPGFTFRAEGSLGVHNLPQFFSLGGWKTPWQITGYPQGVLRGRIAARGRLEASTILSTFNTPFLSMGILKDLRGTVFLEGGLAGEKFSELSSLFTVGGELTLGAFLAEGIPLTVKVGYAKPISSDYPGEWYLEAGVRFR